MNTIFKLWLPYALILTIACGLVYLSVQQVLRQGANDPQIELAETMAQTLASGQNPASIMPQAKFDLMQNLAPFALITDSKGLPLAYSATLDGKPLAIPAGVLSYVNAHGEERLTLQPKAGVRIAAVIDKYQGPSGTGFVLVGRSLREVEKRESSLTIEVGAAWLLGLVILFALMSWLSGEKSLHS